MGYPSAVRLERTAAAVNGCVRLARPYRRLADVYDDVLGRPFFDWIRRIFSALVRRHRIAFNSAADLGCGTGLFARHLSRGWRVPVFAIDASPAMLQVAANNCRHDPVRLLRQDIRQLRLPGQVDLITATSDIVNHLLDPADVQSLFRRVHDHLRDGGHFVFDFIPPCGPKPSLHLFRLRNRDGSRRVTQRILWTPRRRLLSYQVMVHGSPCATPDLEHHAERAYAPQEIAQWLSEAGFILREVLDFADMQPARGCPRRAVVVARKGR